MRRGREGDCSTGIDEDEDADDWDDADADADADADDVDQIVALATSCIVVKCTLDAQKDAHSLTKLPNYLCKQIMIITAGGGTQIQQIER